MQLHTNQLLQAEGPHQVLEVVDATKFNENNSRMVWVKDITTGEAKSIRIRALTRDSATEQNIIRGQTLLAPGISYAGEWQDSDCRTLGIIDVSKIGD